MNDSFYIPSNTITYLDKPYVKIFYDLKTGVITSLFKGFSSVEDVEAIGVRILEAVNIEKAKKVLYDIRLLEVLDEVSEKFISTTFTSKMIDAGVKYSATVMPKDEFAKLSIDNIQKKHSEFNNLAVHYFNSTKEALKWLSKQK